VLALDLSLSRRLTVNDTNDIFILQCHHVLQMQREPRNVNAIRATTARSSRIWGVGWAPAFRRMMVWVPVHQALQTAMPTPAMAVRSTSSRMS
jgi:hypothetical protein